MEQDSVWELLVPSAAGFFERRLQCFASTLAALGSLLGEALVGGRFGAGRGGGCPTMRSW